MDTRCKVQIIPMLTSSINPIDLNQFVFDRTRLHPDLGWVRGVAENAKLIQPFQQKTPDGYGKCGRVNRIGDDCKMSGRVIRGTGLTGEKSGISICAFNEPVSDQASTNIIIDLSAARLCRAHVKRQQLT